MIGTLLDGTYRIESLLGRGGMGAVYKAQHERLRAHFAVKVLDVPAEERRPQLVARFRREARITSALAHPHIVSVTDYNVTDEGNPYIVMELLDGEDLAHYLRRKGQLRLEQAATILQQLAAALQSAHHAGVVHRDLKPSNVFLCRRANDEVLVKVLDFGISKVAGALTAMTLTQQMIGTPAFMAPEQAQGGSSEVDHRADIFSVGAMLYLMLAGKKPFAAESVPQMLFKVVYEEPPPLLDARPDLPLEVGAVVARALSKKPAGRQGSMEALWRDFARAAQLGKAVASLSATRWRLTQSVDLNALAAGLDASATERTAASMPTLLGAETQASLVPEREPALEAVLPAPPSSGGKALGWRFWAVAAAVIVLVAAGSLTLGLSLARRSAGDPSRGGPPLVRQGAGRAAPRIDAGASTARAAPDSSAPGNSGRDGGGGGKLAGGRDAGRSSTRRVSSKRWSHPKPKRRAHVAPARLRVSAISAGRPVPASITLDGRSVGQAPLLLKGLRPGRHRLEARQAGMRRERRQVRLRGGKEHRLVFELRPR